MEPLSYRSSGSGRVKKAVFDTHQKCGLEFVKDLERVCPGRTSVVCVGWWLQPDEGFGSNGIEPLHYRRIGTAELEKPGYGTNQKFEIDFGKRVAGSWCIDTSHLPTQRACYVNKHVLDEKRLSRIVQTIPSSLDRSALISHLAVTGQWRLDAGAVPDGLAPPVMVSSVPAPLTVGRVAAWLRAEGHVDLAERLEPTQRLPGPVPESAPLKPTARPQVVWTKDSGTDHKPVDSGEVESGPWACRDVVGGMRYFKSRDQARRARQEGESVIKVVQS